MKRMLLVAYFYPPLGGPAAIRLGKTVNYLSRKGYLVDVLTVKNIAYHSTDEELAEECKPHALHYASSYDLPTLLYHLKKDRKSPQTKQIQTAGGSLYFFLPDGIRRFIKRLYPVDDKIFWYFGAKKTGLAMLRANQYDIIAASSGPYTAALVAATLAKKSGIPLLIDYRDHWTLNPYEKFLTPWHRMLAEKLERKVIAQASLVTTVGETMRRELQQKFGSLFPVASEVVYNGYDESDFADIDSTGRASKEDFITFTYTGNFYQQRTPRYFCEALLLLKARNLLPDNFRAKFYGNYHRSALSILKAEKLKNIVSIHPYLPHRESIRLLMESACLLLFIPSADGKGVLTSKVFEYLRSGKRILAMIPAESEAVEILSQEKSLYHICHPENSEIIAETILQIISGIRDGKTNKKEQRENWSRYSREAQTDKLIRLLEGLNEKG